MAAIESPALSARRVTLRAVAANWDARAARTGASYQVSLARLRLLAIKTFGRAEVQVLEIVTDSSTDPVVVGQCAVIVRKGGHGSFVDQLVLEPDHSHRWDDAMRALLGHLPSGRYTYGSSTSREESRSEQLAGLAGVSVEQVRPLTVQAIEFGRWPNWPAYRRRISENIRRNAKRAERTYPDLRVVKRHGLAALPHVPKVVRLRSDMYKRKGLAFRPLPAAIGMVVSLLLPGHHAFIATVMGAGHALAAMSVVKFGAVTYYLGGGSKADNQGAAWYLMLDVVEEAYRRDPEGQFMMGYIDPATYTEAEGAGLVRQRHACRASDLHTSVTTFSWAGREG